MRKRYNLKSYGVTIRVDLKTKKDKQFLDLIVDHDRRMEESMKREIENRIFQDANR